MIHRSPFNASPSRTQRRRMPVPPHWVLALLVCATATLAPARAQEAQGAISIPLPSLSPLIESVAPAVVNISVELTEREIAQGNEGFPDFPPSPFDEFLRRFFEQQGIPGAGRALPPRREGHAMALGSGFIIDASGDIVTNNHVVGNADRVTVILQNNRRYPARIVGRDEKTDVALIKIDSKQPLPFVPWGDSDAVKVGDWVVAVGNPFGLGGTVTSGIVSALGRNIEAGPYDDFLQIDASINRDNSGGPAFDLSGHVIGINTAIYSPSGGSVGIGFAVPSNLAKNVVAQLKERGHVTRGWLGVEIQTITPEIAKGLGLDPNNPTGALVADVVPHSPAAQAGLKQGDVITRFNGKQVKDAHDLPRLVAETPVGQKVELAVLRQGEERQLQATIAEAKEQKQSPLTGSSEPESGASGATRRSRHAAFGLERQGASTAGLADERPGRCGGRRGARQPGRRPGRAGGRHHLDQSAARVRPGPGGREPEGSRRKEAGPAPGEPSRQ